MQAAHNEVTQMMNRSADGIDPSPKVHSIVEVEEPEAIDFEDLPPPQE